jgi:prepilin-type N-terminal cleavage/methylation domain-containing protein
MRGSNPPDWTVNPTHVALRSGGLIGEPFIPATPFNLKSFSMSTGFVDRRPLFEAIRIAGFTLIELLVVIAVIVTLLTLAVPAFNAIRGGTDFTSELYNIAAALQQGRAYAMANNTYVLAGITEVSAGQSSTAIPQAGGVGRVIIGLISSKSGVQPYAYYLSSSTALANWAPSSGLGGYGTGNDFSPVGTLIQFPNLHLVDLQYGTAQVPQSTSGAGMARPSGTSAVPAVYDIPNAACTAGTEFAWPLGTAIGSASAMVTFSKVIEFDPQGSARILISSTSTSLQPDALPQYIEIGLQPTHGTGIPPAPASQTSGELGAIQITGISGAIQIYRP